MSLRDAQRDVMVFHMRFQKPCPPRPQLPWQVDWPAMIRRLDWIDDELQEGFDAVGDRSVPELADAFLDQIYFALGGLVELGIDASPLWHAIQKANLAKVNIPGQEKIGKPTGWQAPDIESLIAEQRNRP